MGIKNQSRGIHDATHMLHMLTITPGLSFLTRGTIDSGKTSHYGQSVAISLTLLMHSVFNLSGGGGRGKGWFFSLTLMF